MVIHLEVLNLGSSVEIPSVGVEGIIEAVHVIVLRGHTPLVKYQVFDTAGPKDAMGVEWPADLVKWKEA